MGHTLDLGPPLWILEVWVSAHQGSPRAASMSATTQNSRATISLPKTGQGKKAQVYLERRVGHSQSLWCTVTKSSQGNTTEGYGRDISLPNKAQSWLYGDSTSTRSGWQYCASRRWDKGSERPLLLSAHRKRPRKMCQAPLPTTHSSDLIPRPAEP